MNVFTLLIVRKKRFISAVQEPIEKRSENQTCCLENKESFDIKRNGLFCELVRVFG